MKIKSQKRWYLHLIYYQFLKCLRFFQNLFSTKEEHKFLFILSPPYCGSTLLNQILSTSKNVSCNNPLGVREGQLLPELRDLMFHDRWEVNKYYPWQRIKMTWMKYWDRRKIILLEKSDANMVRVDGIKMTFDNHVFLAMVRNPYAHVEGIIRRNDATIEYAAKFALQCLKYQKMNKENEKNILFISYEELCDNKDIIIKKIQKFIPELGSVDSDLEFTAHNFKTNGKMRIKNLNDEKIGGLSIDKINEINKYFKPNKELINYFGYSIIE